MKIYVDITQSQIDQIRAEEEREVKAILKYIWTGLAVLTAAGIVLACFNH